MIQVWRHTNSSTANETSKRKVKPFKSRTDDSRMTFEFVTHCHIWPLEKKTSDCLRALFDASRIVRNFIAEFGIENKSANQDESHQFATSKIADRSEGTRDYSAEQTETQLPQMGRHQCAAAVAITARHNQSMSIFVFVLVLRGIRGRNPALAQHHILFVQIFILLDHIRTGQRDGSPTKTVAFRRWR